MLVISSCGLVSAMDPDFVQLPSKEILNQRLCNHKSFVEATKLDQILGSKEMYPSSLVMEVQVALYKFNDSYKYPTMTEVLLRHTSEITSTILQDHPQVIESLKQNGLLQ